MAGAEENSQPEDARLRFPTFIITVLNSLSSITAYYFCVLVLLLCSNLW